MEDEFRLAKSETKGSIEIHHIGVARGNLGDGLAGTVISAPK
jgi:hypothetical protein